MPASINDYDKSDENEGGLSEGFTPAQSSAVGSSNGPKQATPSKQEDSGFVPWSSFVSANQDVSQREAGKLSSQVQGEVTKAQGDLSGAQDTFNKGVASNYTTPAKPTGSKKNAPVDGVNQNATPAVSATPQPSGPTERLAPTQRTMDPTRTAVDGSNPFANTGYADQHSPSWASFSGPQALAPSMAAKSSAPTAGQQAMIGLERARTLTPGAAGGNPAGSPDLESAAGQAGWSQLLGDTLTAQQGAHALGSETGVQGLLQQNASGPTNSAFDAALINGQGGPQFRDLSNKYGGHQLGQNVVNAEQASQDKWAQLGGDVKARQAADAAAKGQSAPAADAAPTDTKQKDAGDPTDPSSSAYWDAVAANGNTNLQNLRTDNANGYNATATELGFYGDGGGRVDGHDWVQSLPQMLATGGGGPGSFGGNINQALSGAEQGLGVSKNELYNDLSRMSNSELSDFWALGIIPQWMNTTGGFGKGIVGGWQSPYIQSTLSYGNDGGMWNGLLNFWKTGASTVAAGVPVVGGALSSGIKAVPVNTKQNKYGK